MAPFSKKSSQGAAFNLITSRTWRIASLSVGIQVSFAKPNGGTVSEPEGLINAGDIIRDGGRDHLGMVGEIISEWRARQGSELGLTAVLGLDEV
jgi:hypothetical protein